MIKANLFILFSINLLICCRSQHPKISRIQKDNFSIKKNDTILSNQLNSNYFSNGTLKIKEIFSSKKIISQSQNYYKIDNQYDFPIYLKSIFFSEKDKNSRNNLPDNYIEIGKDKFLYMTLYDKAKLNLPKTSIRPELTHLYSISTINGSNYIAVFAKDMSYNNSFSNELVFLFSLVEDKVTAALFLDDTMFTTDKLFGDYNKNGFLDFLIFSNNLDSIYCKEVVGDKIMILKDKFIAVNTIDGLGEVFTLNKKSSNWWFNN